MKESSGWPSAGRKDDDELLEDAFGGGSRTVEEERAWVPHPERVSDDYAEERIAEKIGMYDRDKPRRGLENVSRDLREAGVPPAWRLHYITAVAHLGRLGQETLDERRREAGGDQP